MSAVTNEGYELTLTKSIAAPPEQVFDAWLDLDLVSRWFSPSEEMETRVTELDPRVGGKYRIEMHSPEGEQYNLTGEYVKLDRPRELVMTFVWESDPDEVMLTTVSFEASDTGTELRLRHEKLPSENARDLHQQGWSGTLARLQLLFD